MKPLKTSFKRAMSSRRREQRPRHFRSDPRSAGTHFRKSVASDRWDGLIQAIVQQLWPELDWRLVKCQVRQESAFNPKAVSSCGAIGLMQIMPSTGLYLGVTRGKLFNPEINLRTGITYLKQQYDHFPEIPDRRERLKFSLASYNGGRGYINQAIALARKEDAPWQTWDGVKDYLAHCTLGGKRPDYRQIVAYVHRIWANYTRLSSAARQMSREMTDIPAMPGSKQEGKTP
jgi:Predicted soluble lytic transglycosylase fused to an ABC-type amino acid-binding protein